MTKEDNLPSHTPVPAAQPCWVPSILPEPCLPKALPEQGGQPALPYAGASRPAVLGALYPA